MEFRVPLIFWFAGLLFFLGCSISPAQSLTPPPASSAEPALILRDTLMAACSQNAPEFARALTIRNAEAFSRMTSASRSTLLKRFVLLEKPGEPRVQTDPSGQILVYCKTPEITSEMQIGKPEFRDNIAYLPLAVSDATAGAESTQHKVTMGMVRENGQWKILSLGLLLLDLPSLEEEWDRAEIKANEQSALATLQKLANAVESYRKTYTRLPESLDALGPAGDRTAKSERAGLLESDIVSGRKDGYIFRYVIVGTGTSGAPAKYELAAFPAEYGRGGLRSFFRDASGIWHAADHHGAVGSDADPRLDAVEAAAAEAHH